MRERTCKFKDMVLHWKKVAFFLHIGGETLPKVNRFRYLWAFLTSEGKMEGMQEGIEVIQLLY